MLAQKYRLRLNKNFQQVYRKKRVLHTPFFTIYLAPNQLAHSRFAFIISNKIAKKAVERNKIRRRLRAWTQKNIKNIKIGQDIIISVKKPLLSQDFAKISQILTDFFKKAKLLL